MEEDKIDRFVRVFMAHEDANERVVALAHGRPIPEAYDLLKARHRELGRMGHLSDAQWAEMRMISHILVYIERGHPEIGD